MIPFFRALIFGFLAGCFSQFIGGNGWAAVPVIDLSNHDFAKKPLIELSGQWQMFQGSLLKPQEIEQQKLM